MPFDVVQEICGHLEPTDLLNLGRVSKYYRNLLKDPAAKSIWVHCRAQYPEAPACPKAMYYAFEYGLTLFKEYQLLETAEQKTIWEEGKLSLAKEAQEHATLCKKWMQIIYTMDKQRRNEEVKERQARVENLFKSMGWEEERVKMSAPDFSPIHSTEIKAICTKPLTEDALRKASKYFEKYITEAKEKKLVREREDATVARLIVLEEAYTAALASVKVDDSTPLISDVCTIPRFKSIVLDTPPGVQITAEDFAITQDTVASIIEEAKEVMRSKLLSLVEKVLNPLPQLEPTAFLNLASITFVYRDRSGAFPNRRPVGATEVHHLDTDHKELNDIANFRLVEGPDASRARDAMDVQSEKDAFGKNQEAKCSRCGHIEGVIYMRIHIHTQHNMDTSLQSAGQEQLSASQLEVSSNTIDTVTKLPDAKKRRIDDKSGPENVDPIETNPPETLLKQLFGMPLDIFLEVCGHLDPTDLLNLARVSKYCRKFLMDPAANCVWTHCRTQYPGGPRCPAGMTEAMFTELAFGYGCMECGSQQRTGCKVIWEIKKRLCSGCMQDDFADYDTIVRLNLPEAIHAMIPRTELEDGEYFAFDYGLELFLGYGPLKTPEQKAVWEKNTLRQLKEVKKHAQMCTKWVQSIQKSRNEQVKERLARIDELIKTMGWGDELAKMSGSDSSPLSHKEIKKICRDPLTEKALRKAKKFIKSYMTEVRKKRLAREREDATVARLRVLEQAYTSALAYVTVDDSTPLISGVCTIPRFKSIVLDTPLGFQITAEDFGITQDTIAWVIEEAKGVMRSKLLTLVEKALNSVQQLESTAAILNLASTTFLYRNQKMPVGATEIMKRSYKRDPTRKDCPSPFEYTIYRTFKTAPLNSNGEISFTRKRYKAACQVSTLCGLDPTTATLADVLEIDSVIECISCNDFHTGRLMMRWIAAVQHLSADHKSLDEIANFCLVEGPDASRALDDMQLQSEKDAFGKNQEAKCKRCGHIEGVIQMRAHIHTQHDVLHPTNVDWIYTDINIWMERAGGTADTAVTGFSNRKRKARKTDSEISQEEGAHDPITSATKKPKTRMKRKGSLTKMLDMPFDILLEIFKHLLPPDLLSLGRVSRDFRRLVMSAEFKSIWINSRSYIPNSPECPQDITEAMFAELTFGKSCLVCGANGSHVYTLWQARTRLCQTCISESFVSVAFIRRLQLPKTISELIPSTGAQNKTRYSSKHANMWANEYDALTTDAEREEWEKTKLEYLATIEGQAEACEAWAIKANEFMVNEKNREVTERKEKLLRMANTMGWADEISRLLHQTLPHNSELQKICHRPLTDYSIENAKCIINDIMTSIRDKRLEGEKRMLYRTRMEFLQTAYNQAVKDWLPNKKAPHVSDFFIVPRIRTVVLDTAPEINVTREHFFDEASFPGLVQEARTTRQEKLLQVIEKGYRAIKMDYDPEIVSKLVTTVFANEKLGLADNNIRTVAQALSLKSVPAWHSDREKMPLVEQIALDVFKCRPWNSDRTIGFDRVGHAIISELVKLCGLDPLTTTLEEMNHLNPIFECVACSRMPRGRLMMRWADAASHIKREHYEYTNSAISLLEIPNDQDAQRARKEVKEAEYQSAFTNNVYSRCKHCGIGAKALAMHYHLTNHHEVETPELDTDWTFSGTVVNINEYWMLPLPSNPEEKPDNVE
ncbi:hypothetical protein CVT24_001960 [Panaeolus cyanescens]|uniref:F-box domain-containing protein n=1 Tax=Panaeolus cyanescens TaxID=181874 RepID=A0A409YHR9_9AGAR|nr:hypothetical protein CVT24_001960 [Panaeolus cyanescens]